MCLAIKFIVVQFYYSRADSFNCSHVCQVTTCKVCIFTNHTIGMSDMPKECVEKICEDLKCVVKWSRCAYEKISTYQVRYS